MWCFEREDYDLFDRCVSLDDISKEVDGEYESMPDDEKHFRLIHNDPTFLQIVYTTMCCGKYSKAIINDFTNKIEEYKD